jgi:hypothetical protein
MLLNKPQNLNKRAVPGEVASTQPWIFFHKLLVSDAQRLLGTIHGIQLA